MNSTHSRHRWRNRHDVIQHPPRSYSLRPFSHSLLLHLPVLLLSLLLPSPTPLFPSRHGSCVVSALGSACTSGLQCENGGVCVHLPKAGDVCRCTKPTSAIDPYFFVGSRCHIPAVMCADTDSWYCANGATCVEVVQGENYTCDGCNAAVAGPHCDAEGVPCGSGGLKCFNGGTCSQSAQACVCPPAWSGNENCTAPAGQDSGSGSPGEEEEQTWYVPLLGALGALVMLTILGGLIYLCYAGQSQPTHQPISSLAAIKDAEEILSLQEHGHDEDGEEDETFELAEAQRLQAIEDQTSPR